MTKHKIQEQYKEMFSREVTGLEFMSWMQGCLTAFTANVGGTAPKTIEEWMEWFLAWTEFDGG